MLSIKPTHGLSIFLILFLIFFAVGIILGARQQFNEQDILREECVLTDMYIIGNKGYVGRVYDCKNVRMTDE